MDWQHLDMQMKRWAHWLTTDVKIAPDDASELATGIAADMLALPLESRRELEKATPVAVTDRLDELKAFQSFMDMAASVAGHPDFTRAHVIVQNYVCFLYLPESCFRVMKQVTPKGSVAHNCARFLTDNPVRAFRNAIAHANWSYRSDFEAIVYWARKGDGEDEPLSQFEVEQERLNFWQRLSRCVGYVALSTLRQGATS